MRFDLTRQTLSQTILLFIILYIILWSRELFFDIIPSLEYGKDTLGLAGKINILVDKVPYLGRGILMVLLLINSFMLTRIALKNLFYIDKTYTITILYLILCSSVLLYNASYVSQISLYFILRGTGISLKIYKNKDAIRPFFIGAFFYGLASLLSLPSIAYIICLFANLISFRRMEWREWLSVTIGFFLPSLCYSYISWVMGNPITIYITDLASTFRELLPYAFDYNLKMIPDLILPGVCVLFMICSVITFFSNLESVRTRTIRVYNIFLSMSLLCLTFLIVFPSTALSIMPFIAVPGSVMISIFFTQIRRNYLRNILFIVIILVAILSSIGNDILSTYL